MNNARGARRPPREPVCQQVERRAKEDPRFFRCAAWNAILNAQAAGDWITALETAFSALEQAASSTSVFAPADVCSAALRRAIDLIAGIPTLTDDARLKFQTFIGSVPNTPARDTALNAASAALFALDGRIKAIDAAFASR